MDIIWAPQAVSDLDAALVYLAERNPEAASALANAILNLVERLAAEPLEGSVCVLRTGETVNSWPLRPFRVYYQRKEAVFRVVRVYHQSANRSRGEVVRRGPRDATNFSREIMRFALRSKKST